MIPFQSVIMAFYILSIGSDHAATQLENKLKLQQSEDERKQILTTGHVSTHYSKLKQLIL